MRAKIINCYYKQNVKIKDKTFITFSSFCLLIVAFLTDEHNNIILALLFALLGSLSFFSVVTDALYDFYFYRVSFSQGERYFS